ncbi:YdcH family protein [Streptomyces radicis]|uniref:CopG family transcriptional regulator n=1 Tax=Streptomyces radicis TaxID=1750517 RepID=A0A3A9W8R1_9ACTN|nr:YdcH family protein [Streptomyces radicis]RKN08733.1 hypothetical protein D7319_15220 [Streptomyces radicis]RKN21891.1 hypothetical protein D7318_16175 [Streptomyces radicis]
MSTTPRAHAPATARETERYHLDQLISAAEAEHGPITDEEIRALRERLHEAREKQAPGGVSTDRRPRATSSS